MLSPADRIPAAVSAGASIALWLAAAVAAADTAPAGPGLGQPVPSDQIEDMALDIAPDGRGLPPGSGSATLGRELFESHCAGCHGEGGIGGNAEALSGAEEPLDSEWAEKTVGSFWPYAPMLYDFIRRAKPMAAPGSFSAAEVYALTAYLLEVNGIVDGGTLLDRATLSGIAMPNRDGFQRCYPQPGSAQPARVRCRP
jgi:cytochrome c